MSEATERKPLKKYIRRELTEEELYDLVSEVLELKFRALGDVHLEITATGRFSEKMKDELEDYSLFILNIERMSPDLTGFISDEEKFGKSKPIIVVEVKKRSTLKDIYQTKRYAEILKATYALLISPEKLSPERRKFLIKRREEITRFHPNLQVLIGQSRRTREPMTRPNVFPMSIQIDKDLYYNVPEPFKEESK